MSERASGFVEARRPEAGLAAPGRSDGPQPLPPGFVESVVDRAFRVCAPWRHVWTWLENPETFSGGQVWPFRVEFVAETPDHEAGFHEGGLNIHHGPLLSLPGRLTEIRETDDGAYRSLEYLYGSYVVSLRLVRPTRLEFWVDPEGEATTKVQLRLSSHVHPLIEGVWDSLQHVFWARFPRWMARSLDAEIIR